MIGYFKWEFLIQFLYLKNSPEWANFLNIKMADEAKCRECQFLYLNNSPEWANFLNIKMAGEAKCRECQFLYFKYSS